MTIFGKAQSGHHAEKNFDTAVDIIESPPMLSSLALIVVIVIDQFRPDEYARIKQQLAKSGLAQLIDRGIYYDEAHQPHQFTLTCPGHVAVSTGALPGLHGVMFNDEWDRERGHRIYCVADPEHKWLSADADNANPFAIGTSAKRILTTTVGDEMKHIWGQDTRVVSVSLKDRSAIGLAGHVADSVYWFAPKTGIWTTSTAYAKELPSWVTAFNQKLKNRKTPKLDDGYYSSLEGITDTTDLALLAADAEKLGQHKKPDVLWISYSTHDYVGHEHGDNSKELHEVILAEDKNISRLISELQKKLGSKKILVALTGDHGAGVDSEKAKKLKIPAGKFAGPKNFERVNKCLGQSGNTAVSTSYFNITLPENTKDKAQARIKAKECLTSFGDGVWYAFTREEIMAGSYPKVPWLKNLAGHYHPTRGPDVIGVMSPYWNSVDVEAVMHETPYDYDSWVPLAVWWPGIKAKKVYRRVEVTSLATTLTRILGTRRTSGGTSDVLTEVLEAANP